MRIYTFRFQIEGEMSKDDAHSHLVKGLIEKEQSSIDVLQDSIIDVR